MAKNEEEEKTMKIKRLGRTGLKVSEICLVALPEEADYFQN